MKRGLAGGLRGVLASGHRRVDLKGPLVNERNDLADAEGGNANDHGGSEGVVEGLNLGRKIGRHCNDNHRDGETRSCSGVGGVIDFELRSLEVAEGEGEPDVEPVQVEGKPLHLHALPADCDAADPDVLGSADGGDEGEEPVHVQDVENDGRHNEEHHNGFAVSVPRRDKQEKILHESIADRQRHANPSDKEYRGVNELKYDVGLAPLPKQKHPASVNVQDERGALRQ
mmetsp:Transcript_8204/g.16432  ORF Transcript_8204/g.16432 Transcript_8204/m.16432 type:complete len:228 (-) Transcript_8204:608-1291(-)